MTQNNSKPDIQFSGITISTMTCAGSLAKSPTDASNDLVNIYAVAKRMPLDDTIVGIKLVYAAGQSSVIRGACALSKRKKDFYNQVTFNVRVSESSMISYKIFHNGAVQLTGAHNTQDAVKGTNMLLERLKLINGTSVIKLTSMTNGVLVTHDHLVYSWDGKIIGYLHEKNGVYLNGEYVEHSKYGKHDVLVSKRWVNHYKNMYTCDGTLIGRRKLTFRKGVSKSFYRKDFQVHDGEVYFGGELYGNETVELDHATAIELLEQGTECRQKYIYPSQKVIHVYKALQKPHEMRLEGLTQDDIKIYNVNARFEVNFRINREKLWKKFIATGLNAKYDSCSHLGVNLRYHYLAGELQSENHPNTTTNIQDRGKCLCENGVQAGRNCTKCKVVSLLCFVSGKIVLTGLRSLQEAEGVALFIKDFYTRYYDDIKSLPKTPISKANLQEETKTETVIDKLGERVERFIPTTLSH